MDGSLLEAACIQIGTQEVHSQSPSHSASTDDGDSTGATSTDDEESTDMINYTLFSNETFTIGIIDHENSYADIDENRIFSNGVNIIQ